MLGTPRWIQAAVIVLCASTMSARVKSDSDTHAKEAVHGFYQAWNDFFSSDSGESYRQELAGLISEDFRFCSDVLDDCLSFNEFYETLEEIRNGELFNVPTQVFIQITNDLIQTGTENGSLYALLDIEALVRWNACFESWKSSVVWWFNSAGQISECHMQSVHHDDFERIFTRVVSGETCGDGNTSDVDDSGIR